MMLESPIESPIAPPAPGASPAAHAYRAGLRAALHEEFEQARDHLERAIADEPGHADALAYLSSVHCALGDVEAARAVSDQALSLDPNGFASNQKAAELDLRLGNPESAERRFLAALRATEPGTPAARAAEIGLRAARERRARGIGHQAELPGRPALLTRWVTAASGLQMRFGRTRRAGSPD